MAIALGKRHNAAMGAHKPTRRATPGYPAPVLRRWRRQYAFPARRALWRNSLESLQPPMAQVQSAWGAFLSPLSLGMQ
ncbi:MAG: hypothetical protein P8015_19420, partial [Acidihalobacter sp.]